jgi:hypothetical protein
MKQIGATKERECLNGSNEKECHIMELMKSNEKDCHIMELIKSNEKDCHVMELMKSNEKDCYIMELMIERDCHINRTNQTGCNIQETNGEPVREIVYFTEPT